MNFVFPPPISGSGLGEGAIHYVASNAEAKALSGLNVGDVVYVTGTNDPFIVVDDDSLASDGGTVLIPDSELSAIVEEVIPETTFDTGGVDTALEYDLAHAGIDLESIECVFTDAGETVSGWRLHGHMMSHWAGRENTPQFPNVDTGRGKLRDPNAMLTFHVNHRTGGMLIRYRYALTGLRLKRMTGPTFDLRWWPVTGVSQETGTQIDNGDSIRWACIAAARAGAKEIYFHEFYHFSRLIEVPHGVAWVGRGLDLSGIRVMDGMGYWELLLTNSSTPDITKHPLVDANNPIRRFDYYENFMAASTPTIMPAEGATRCEWRNFKYDGNVYNNLFWDHKDDYAWSFVNSTSYFHNAPWYSGLSWSNQSGRVIPAGSRLFLHEVEISGVGGPGALLGNSNCSCISTGRLRLGDVMHGHLIYHMDGQYERIETFGFCFGDGLRVRSVHIGHWHDRPYRKPDELYAGAAGSIYAADHTEFRLSYSGAEEALSLWPGTARPPHSCIIDYWDADYTGVDVESPYTGAVVFPLIVAGGSFHIYAGHLRLARTHNAPPLILPVSNGLHYGPFTNVSVKATVEVPNRGGFQLFSTFANWNFFSRADFDITVESFAASHIPEVPSPSGRTVFMVVSAMQTADGQDGEIIDFVGAVAATLSGEYVDLICPDSGLPTFRVWFDYNGTSTPPSTDPIAPGTTATLIEVEVGVGATPAAIAAAFSAAVRANAAAYALLTCATFNDEVVVGSLTRYRAYPDNQVIVGVSHATGVTTRARAHHRVYEPSNVDFRVWAPDPTYQSIANITLGSERDLTLNFKDSAIGAYHASYMWMGSSGSLATAAIIAAKDRLHFHFEDSILDIRDGAIWQNLDLLLYSGRFRNCRFRTAPVATGIPTLGTGYEELYSEQSGMATFTPSGVATTYDIQTKLFNIPKDGNTRIYPANAAAAALWNTVYPSWRRSSRPAVGGASVALGGSGAFYQGPASISEDRRAPMLRLNFSAAPAAAELAVGWSAAVSP